MAEKNGILLESGTNELEIVEFCIDDGETPMYCGVNVAKVREIILKPKLRSVIAAPQSVAGMITLRNKVLPVIDLGQILGLCPAKASSSTLSKERASNAPTTLAWSKGIPKNRVKDSRMAGVKAGAPLLANRTLEA